jgi:hypothetical protein
MRFPALVAFAFLTAVAQNKDAALSKRLGEDAPLDTQPASRLWKDAPAVYAEAGPANEPTPGHRTEIRSRWSGRSLYFLFTCPYETLYLLPNPNTSGETNKLWDHDVAEVFIGADFEKIWQYREFQVSPQGEWVDLAIDRKEPKAAGGWKWNSGFEVQARIDRTAKVWYGAFKIPIESINGGTAKEGAEYRVNFYRIQGPLPDRLLIAWRPTMQGTFHVPEKFGILRLTN